MSKSWIVYGVSSLLSFGLFYYFTTFHELDPIDDSALMAVTNVDETPINNQPGIKAGVSGIVDWLVPIDAQLSALKRGDIEEAYQQTTSKDFQKSTSLEDFIQYVSKYPVLKNYSEISVKQQAEQDNKFFANIVLDPGKNPTTVVYVLVKEEGKWKIWNMQVTPSRRPETESLLSDTSAMKVPVDQLLSFLRKGEISQAYFVPTSAGFRQTTSLDAFEKFVNEYPILINQVGADLKEPHVENETGRIIVEIKGKEGSITVEFTLGIESNQWKILGIHLVNPMTMKESVSSSGVTTGKDLSGLEFLKLEVGTQVTASGMILSPSTLFSVPSGPVYFALEVKNGKAGTKIDLTLEHLESHAIIPPVSTTLQKDGPSTLTFSIEPPLDGWKKGHYQVEAKASTGTRGLWPFIME